MRLPRGIAFPRGFPSEEDEEWTEGGERRPQAKKRPTPGTKAQAAKRPKPPPSINSDNTVEAQEASFEPISPTTTRKPLLLWRKYGQKKLKGKPWKGIVRCYYKCHFSTCPAKKFIEKSASDLNHVLGVKFESEHNHYIAPGELMDNGEPGEDLEQEREEQDSNSESASPTAPTTPTSVKEEGAREE